MNIVAVLASVIILTACAGNQVSEKAQAERPAGTGDVVVRIEGVSSTEGAVYASIFLNEEGFPEEKELAYTYQSAPAIAEPIEFTFTDIPAGWIVVAVLHDADMNEELTLGMLGIPEEKYGFSLNPDSLFGPPSFDESAVELKDGETRRLVIEIK